MSDPVIHVPCDHCGTTGVRVDEDGRDRVCGSCMGHGYLSETPNNTHEPQLDIRHADLRTPDEVANAS